MSLKKLLVFIQIVFLASLVFSNDAIDNDLINGVKKYQKQEYIDSVFYFDKVIDKKNSFLRESIYWKAKSLFELNMYPQSRKTLEDFFRIANFSTPYYEDARFLYCKIFFKLERYNDSILLLNQYIRNSDFNFYRTSAYFWLGESYLQLSKMELALEQYKKYLLVKPNNNIVKSRVENISNILATMNGSRVTSDSDRSEKIEWFSEYLKKEEKGEIVGGNNLGELLNSFTDKEEFFLWLSKFKVIADNEVADKDVTDKDVTDKDVTDKDVTDKEATDKEATDKEATDKEATDKDVDSVDASMEEDKIVKDLITEETTVPTEVLEDSFSDIIDSNEEVSTDGVSSPEDIIIDEDDSITDNKNIETEELDAIEEALLNRMEEKILQKLGAKK